MMANDGKSAWFRYLGPVLVVLLALLLVFSKGERAARRSVLNDGREAPAVAEAEGSEASLAGSLRVSLNGREDNTDMDASEDLTGISLDRLMGRVNPASDSLFVPVAQRFASRSGLFMHRDAYRAFLDMETAAREDGIRLTILSALRTFDHQKRLWEDKWFGRRVLSGGIHAPSIADPAERAREILKFSAMPGTSRHHWGTDIDLNALDNDYFEAGEGLAVYRWLQEHAAAFGFCQPYTALGSGRSQGHAEERWHWSYKPLAAVYTEAFGRLAGYGDITGFGGWETAGEVRVIENYVIQVDPSCLKP
jgi:hypothetical protein